MQKANNNEDDDDVFTAAAHNLLPVLRVTARDYIAITKASANIICTGSRYPRRLESAHLKNSSTCKINHII